MSIELNGEIITIIRKRYLNGVEQTPSYTYITNANEIKTELNNTERELAELQTRLTSLNSLKADIEEIISDCEIS